MSEDSGLEQLPDYVVAYLATLGTTPEKLARYRNTYHVFATEMSSDEIKALDTLGAALALDDPKGDNHKNADATEDADVTQEPGEKLKKYLCAVH